MGGAVLILIGLAAGGRIGRITPAGLALLLYMALLSTVSFILWAELLKYNPVGKVAIFGFSIPVFGVVLSAIFLEEQVFPVPEPYGPFAGQPGNLSGQHGSFRESGG